VLSGAGVTVVVDSWRPLADAVGLQVRRLAVQDPLEVALVWQRRPLSPAAAAFMAVAEDRGVAPAADS
jgi:DNA-binding transcriptional LysR family regulator